MTGARKANTDEIVRLEQMRHCRPRRARSRDPGDGVPRATHTGKSPSRRAGIRASALHCPVMAGERTRDAECRDRGGSIGGASASLHLALHGRRVTVPERARSPSGASASMLGMNRFDRLGAMRRISRQASAAGSLDLFKEIGATSGEDIRARHRARSRPSTPRRSTPPRGRVARPRARACDRLLGIRDGRSLEPALTGAPRRRLLAAAFQAGSRRATRASRGSP